MPSDQEENISRVGKSLPDDHPSKRRCLVSVAASTSDSTRSIHPDEEGAFTVEEVNCSSPVKAGGKEDVAEEREAIVNLAPESHCSYVEDISAPKSSKKNFLSFNLSEIPKPSSFPTFYVMYPPYLYSSPWCNFPNRWPSNYKPGSYQSFSSSCHLGKSHRNNFGFPSLEFVQRGPRNQSTGSEMTGNRQPQQGQVPQNCQEELEAREKETQWKANSSLSQEEQAISPFNGQPIQGISNASPWHLQEGFIDTHCRLDVLYGKLSFQGPFAKLKEFFKSSFANEFQGCITNFCDPRTLRTYPWRDMLEEDHVWGTFGCHPHFSRVYSERQEKNIVSALSHPKAVGFGEIGLDYSHKCTISVFDQQKVFERQLHLGVALRKPLVLYCREADANMLEILKKIVPSDHKIHRHGFMGNYNTIKPFLEYFPNLYVGFTAILTYSSAWEVRKAVKQIPLERIVVETNAPYFLPYKVPKSLIRYSHPGMALKVVEEIAKLKNESLSHTLAILKKNTCHLYNL
ncbi:putative deoxyribonuclease TATDN2 [Tachyglossus aculeatus]|uniref:putative deoxyribonuclease TATDN2 n=1 Tax=Tachyglossus aculeatus TaxID=9261 RepID=UPI0018F6C0BA|nr:putative deoxyribonuclease TATDN2 [Tachyglossus aculeatus]XP_038596345.1 putative deoxyribonuclease TATDN2 [Tachyglossus aculeatus]